MYSGVIVGVAVVVILVVGFSKVFTVVIMITGRGNPCKNDAFELKAAILDFGR